MDSLQQQYEKWVKTVTDKDVCAELASISGDYAKIEDAFYRNLEFGTGGLRGVIGAGTNRMNVYTVAKASQGLANYVCEHYKGADRRIAVSYDSRIKSDVFARVAAEVFAANGIKVFIYSELMPTPCLSFAVRKLNCAAGIMVTASHNPAKYNGYKVYGSDGCQITSEAADEIFANIERLDIFADIKRTDFDACVAAKTVEYIDKSVEDEFIACVKAQSVLGKGDAVNKNVAIVYTPLNGTGLKPVTRILKECGFNNVTVVKEQELPDGNFPTCPYPNPEIKEALTLGLQYAEKCNADLLLATDPDCDRVGIAVKDEAGEYRLITGNEVGCLLLDYICARRIANGTMPACPVLVKTIVSTDLADKIADYYGVKTVNVLTGFKFIGEQIGLLEKAGKESSYILGFEESYGYLTGSYVRDKDAVDGVLMIAEMFAYYKTNGIGLYEKLQQLYKQFGHYVCTLECFQFEGSAGFKKMQDIMADYRKATDVDGKAIVSKKDYVNGLDGLPKSNVIKFALEDGSTMVVRPSGTEPKLKIYKCFIQK